MSDSRKNTPALVWFRNDLRLTDSPALRAAERSERPLIALYILEEGDGGPRAFGAAGRWWLHGALASLRSGLAEAGCELILRRGMAAEVLEGLKAETDFAELFWTRRYEAGGIAVDRAIKTAFTERGVTVHSFNGSLLYEPWTVKSAAGGPFKVFSAFWRAARAAPTAAVPAPAPAPTSIASYRAELASDDLEDWGLTPHAPDWAGGLRDNWTPSEPAAHARLKAFLDHGLDGYADGRDRPDRPSTSRLSPYLRFGQISPGQIVCAAQERLQSGRAKERDAAKFLSELGWREFSYHLLYHFPDLGEANFQPKFDAFPWRDDPAALAAWQQGRTGYPIVDAGLRELWHTGWMHNRVRMVAASFLIKHLMTDWRQGEAWFWDTLVDADAANNAASWQWVAGSGADAAPYFRIFNPILQGKKFDPKGAYVRAWVPELAGLPDAHIHAPWEAPQSVLQQAGVCLGTTYPNPIVDHGMGRERALAAFKALSE